MRYHIDTIPVWDAMKLDGECLLCALERKTELGEAERYLGASVMEPDVRVKVNDRTSRDAVLHEESAGTRPDAGKSYDRDPGEAGEDLRGP